MEVQVCHKQIASYGMNGIAMLIVAVALMVTLANAGFIARPSSDTFTFGGY